MGKYKDLIGQKFGKLTVISLDEEKSKKLISHIGIVCVNVVIQKQ